jgi:cytidylate kinase
MIISFSGDPGSGKSTVAKKIAEKLKWPRYYAGGIMRQKAKERGMTVSEYNKLCEKDKSLDVEIENYIEKLGKTDDNFIIESRTAWHFIPNSLKIHIQVDEVVGATRIFNELKENDDRNEDTNLKTVYAVIKSNQERKKNEHDRYLSHYNINISDKNNYDYVLDTTNLNKDEVFENIFNYINKKLINNI